MYRCLAVENMPWNCVCAVTHKCFLCGLTVTIVRCSTKVLVQRSCGINTSLTVVFKFAVLFVFRGNVTWFVRYRDQRPLIGNLAGAHRQNKYQVHTVKRENVVGKRMHWILCMNVFVRTVFTAVRGQLHAPT